MLFPNFRDERLKVKALDLEPCIVSGVLYADSFKDLLTQLKTIPQPNLDAMANQLANFLVTKWERDIYQKNQSYFDSYFRVLYRLFKSIDENQYFSDQEKKDFAKLVRAQLANVELYFLAINGATERGKNFKKKFYSKYELFDNLAEETPWLSWIVYRLAEKSPD